MRKLEDYINMENESVEHYSFSDSLTSNICFAHTITCSFPRDTSQPGRSVTQCLLAVPKWKIVWAQGKPKKIACLPMDHNSLIHRHVAEGTAPRSRQARSIRPHLAPSPLLRSLHQNLKHIHTHTRTQILRTHLIR